MTSYINIYRIPIPGRDPSSKPNPVFVKLLQDGLTRLWNGRSSTINWGYEYICVTLDENVVGSGHLRDIIEDRLFATGSIATMTYRKWAYQFGTFSTEELQAGRKAWMLDLIEEFS